MKRALIILAFALFALGTTAGNGASIDFDLYGSLKLDGAYDQNLTSHGNFVMWVDPQQFEDNDEQYNMTANESRFGIMLTGNEYENAEVNGKIEFDLYAGSSSGAVAENEPMLLLRHAYFSVQMGGTKIIAGQTYDMISPLNPSTLNYPVLWGCGNIGYRRPQISLWQSFGSGENTDMTIAGGFFRTIGSDLTPTFTLAAGESADGTDDGTDAGIPSFQGMFDVKHNFSSGSSARFGISGLWGTLKSETNLGGSENYDSWAINGHMSFAFPNGYGFMGEIYTGSNLQSYLGGILNNSSIEGVNSTGGWASAWMQASNRVKLSAGFGMDTVDKEDIGTGRSKNQSIFGNVNYTLVENVILGAELSYWDTEYVNIDESTDSYDNLRLQTSMILNF
ncbi:MAG TPA: hypothetical protein ENO07_04735 [candidate division Zixibacteria bacterium]|nr:hypothetical protein [candidate division Zixibacteria bacterium]